MVLRPVPMDKVALVGLRSDEEKILTLLHDLRVAQIEPLSPAALAELGPERGSETLRRVGDETLRFRGLLAVLPQGLAPERRQFASLQDVFALAAEVKIDAEVGELARKDDRLQTERKAANDTIAALRKIDFYPDRLDLLRSKSLLALSGEAPADAVDRLRAALPSSADATFFVRPLDETTRFLLVSRASAGEEVASAAQREGIRLLPLPEGDGTVPEEIEIRRKRQEELGGQHDKIQEQLREISRKWYPTVAAILEALEVENRKAEVLTHLGASQETFALEAWVPRRKVPELREVVERESQGRVSLTTVSTDEEPPTELSNPRGVRRFEFFVRFYSLPQGWEWDPTLVFSIVFPILFGFMLGDWGYGLVILGIALWMIAGFPGARHLPRLGRSFVKMIMGPKAMQQLAWALLPGCAIAIGLGLFWDEFFGFGVLHTLFGYAAPIKPEPNVGLLLLFAGYVGLAMVVLGFLLGAIKEYLHHRPRGVVAKSGGIAFAVGIAFLGLALIHHAATPSGHPLVYLWYACVGLGLALLIGGEGIQAGMLGLIEVVSHILSYTRLVGILLASVILAFVINTIAIGRLHAGGPLEPLWILIGLFVLVAGQAFNIILGVFEPGIQGARLIFVEFFSKFYSGNGRPFHPFGVPRTHTVSSLERDGPRGPIIRTPRP